MNGVTLTSGPAPSLIMFFIVPSEAARGSIGTNPFEFKHYKATEFTLYINSDMFPSIPIKYDFDTSSVS